MDNNDWESPAAAKPTECTVCEAMLPDAVDGLLSEAEQRAFDKHVATCTTCSEELEEAQRGAAWLQMLKGSSPEPSPLLLSKILAQTTGAEAASALATPPMRDDAAHEWGTQGVPVRPVPQRESVMAFATRKLVDIFSIQKATMHFQPRLAMTAAMAFFSVALTLNMTGIKLASLKASNFRPSAIRRSVADTSASAMRSFQNMRVVYQFESKLEDMRDTSSTGAQTQPANSTSEQDVPANGNSTNRDQQQHSQSGQKSNPRGHSSLQFPLARRNASVQGV